MCSMQAWISSGISAKRCRPRLTLAAFSGQVRMRSTARPVGGVPKGLEIVAVAPEQRAGEDLAAALVDRMGEADGHAPRLGDDGGRIGRSTALPPAMWSASDSIFVARRSMILPESDSCSFVADRPIRTLCTATPLLEPARILQSGPNRRPALS